MLTSTFALVAFSVEHAELRNELLLCRAHAREKFHLDRGAVDSAAGLLDQIHRRFSWRKLERYLVPALRKVSGAADALLAELGAIGERAGAILAALRTRLAAPGRACLNEACSDIEQYCSVQLERLAREEGELFPLARRLVPRDGWFAMARQIMQGDARSEAPREPRPDQTAGSRTPAFTGHDGGPGLVPSLA
jgi:hypothetical protein